MPTIDPEKLHPNWTRMRKLQEDITRKALDVPEDDVNITTTKGISGGLAIAGLLGSVGMTSVAACIIAYMLSGEPAPPAAPQDSAYSVEFFDQFGEPIYVPPKD